MSTPFFARCAQPGKSKKPAAGLRQHRRSDQNGDRSGKAADGCAALGGLDALRRAFRPALRRLLRHCPRESARLRRVTVSVPAAAASAAGARAGVLSKPAAPAPPRCHRPRCKPLVGCRGIASLVRPPARVSPPAPISRGGKAAAYKIPVLSNCRISAN